METWRNRGAPGKVDNPNFLVHVNNGLNSEDLSEFVSGSNHTQAIVCICLGGTMPFPRSTLVHDKRAHLVGINL